MHNSTPLETAMHLKELERQATPMLGSMRGQRRAASALTSIRTALTALLRCAQAMRISAQAASQSKLYSSSLTSPQ
jgi:hypothetical protein